VKLPPTFATAIGSDDWTYLDDGSIISWDRRAIVMSRGDVVEIKLEGYEDSIISSADPSSVEEALAFFLFENPRDI